MTVPESNIDSLPVVVPALEAICLATAHIGIGAPVQAGVLCNSELLNSMEHN